MNGLFIVSSAAIFGIFFALAGLLWACVALFVWCVFLAWVDTA